MKEYLYVKLLLYAYPKLGMLEESSRSSAEIKAALSFRTQCDAYTAAVKVADEVLMAERLRALAEAIGEIVEECTEGERFLLEYRYFRRKGELGSFAGKCPVRCTKRTYFRLQEYLLSKMAAKLAARGYTRERVIEEFGEYPPFRRVYRALKEGKERAVVLKRKRQEPGLCQKSSDGETRGFLPRRMSTAMARTARTAALTKSWCRRARSHRHFWQSLPPDGPQSPD